MTFPTTGEYLNYDAATLPLGHYSHSVIQSYVPPSMTACFYCLFTVVAKKIGSIWTIAAGDGESIFFLSHLSAAYRHNVPVLAHLAAEHAFLQDGGLGAESRFQ